MLPPLWCAGKLGSCPEDVDRFRFTCLFCRWRRRYYGKFTDPTFWIEYAYKSQICEEIVDYFVKDGLIFTATNGGKLRHTIYPTVKIDPRGHFTSLRCATIIVLDEIMKALGVGKPLVEFCEFLANYPTW